ncbi:glycosyltransferase [Rhodomicrobium lacus]|uniref:glycosyltransferase n=1 Tax=Rhodomicrobium lacus TaxID=2498452 RepID=UPI000F8CDC2B|nr:glycosyltransferase [Rhodomicrobium lacus]
MTVELTLGGVALAAWVFLLAARGGFWRANVREESERAIAPATWPSVTAVIPARNEADVIDRCISSLLAQDYPARLDVVLVDDQSDDGTSKVARKAAEALGASDRLTIISGQPLPRGWTGKLWAVNQGIAEASSRPVPSRYLLLTDADIAYDQGVVRRLVARSEGRGLVLNSLMVKLRCESFAERMLIPAFVFFFQMLYPFSWVNRRDHPMAAAAGGCMLARRDALEAAGGIRAIRSSLIDDCALGRAMKRKGPVWLGLTDSVHSLRPYPHFEDIRKMVARSAYDQLNYSPLLLAGTVIGMMLTYLIPLWLAVFGTGLAQAAGAISFVLMTAAFWPIVRFYRLSPLWSAALPAIAVLYITFTVDSALQQWRGKGGLWKGRVQAQRAEAS